MKKITLIILAATLIFVSCTNNQETTSVSNTDTTLVDSSLNNDELSNLVDSIFAVDSIR